MEATTISRLRHSGIIAIGRGVPGDGLLRTAEALYQGGIRLLELTYNQSDPRALELLPQAVGLLVQRFPDMDIGAGTVLTPEQVDAVARVGAKFIVSPNTDAAVIGRTKELGLMSVPGAMTPSEIVAANLAGADFVKLFPASRLGIGYVKDIKAPLSHIGLLATGGVTMDNFREFLDAGCCGAGIGSPLFRKDLIAAGDWEGIRKAAAGFVEIYRCFAEG